MSIALPTRTRALFATTVAIVAAALTLAAAPAAHAAIVINEVESDGASDFFELKNTGADAVDIGNYVIKDSGEGNPFTIPGGTMLAPGAYFSADPAPLGFGGSDAVRLFVDNVAADPIDSFSWTTHAAATFGRCPDGSGPMGQTSAPTPGAANTCPTPALAWPGSSTVATADPLGTFGANLSGLTYAPSGTSAPGVLWAVRNGPATLFRLVFNGTTWTPDTTNGWQNGKQLLFPGGGGVPDAEGVTLAGGDATGIFVSIERNDDGPAAGTSRPSILRYDTSAATPTLTATRDFDLTADNPGLAANAGFEAVTWIPDNVLVAKGFKDEATGTAYTPATYPNHGAGLFVVGVEQTGELRAYALDLTTGAGTRVATFPSGFSKVMALEFEPETSRLWAVCDDSCNGRSATLDVAQSGADAGRYRITAVYDRPAGMADLNNEGFAIAPQAHCVASRKPVFWSDDASTDGHALRSGTLGCTVATAPGGGGGGTPTPPTTPVEPGAATGTPPATAPPVAPPVLAQGDRTAPRVVLSKPSRAALRNIRRTGRFAVAFTLDEAATVTITATARRTAKGRARTLTKTTRRAVRSGKRSFALTLSRAVRRKLRQREFLTITVVARDGTGNATTRRVTTRVP